MAGTQEPVTICSITWSCCHATSRFARDTPSTPVCQLSANATSVHGLPQESFLDEGFILDKKIGVGQPKRLENANILVANTAMDTDKIKIYGARVRVDSMQKARQPCACIGQVSGLLSDADTL